uniref:Uncharacterized protein n=1 Tax=Rhizophora mucronata TaxID=61149 RepID=A0A2P2QKR5_RHIMU
MILVGCTRVFPLHISLWSPSHAHWALYFNQH